MGKWFIYNKWVLTSILYVAIVIGGFSTYDEFYADQTQVVSAAKHEGTENHSPSEGFHAESSHAHGTSSTHEGINEVNTYVQTDGAEIRIFLRDKTGNPVNDLEINHEKLFHLIIVDEHLQQYYHVHPEPMGNGEFRVGKQLSAGFYKAFIDIKPKSLAYHVTPVPFIVGRPSGLADPLHEGLRPDTDLMQTVEGEKVELNLSSLHTNQPVTLAFDLNKNNLSPYLGAMGHVVILDENAQTFLHVHPANEQEPIFKTEFKRPGIYKIWAEFQQNGKVRAFPFVVEIKGED